MGELNDADANAITWEEACDLERKLCHRPKAKKYLGAFTKRRCTRIREQEKYVNELTRITLQLGYNVLNFNAVQRLLEVNDVPQDLPEKRNIFLIKYFVML